MRLSAAASARIRRITVFTVLALAAAAAVLSFTGLQVLALEAGFPPQLAWLFPIIIDGLVITGSLGVIASTLTGVGTWYPWLLTIVGVGASVVGNVIAAPDDPVSRAVHATPPIVFALAVEGLLRVYRIEAVATMNAPPRAPRAPRTPANGSVPSDTPTLPPSPAERPTAAVAARESVVTDTGETAGKTTRERVRELLDAEPDITAAEVARRLGTDPSHTRRIVRELRPSSPTVGEEPAAADTPAEGDQSLEPSSI